MVNGDFTENGGHIINKGSRAICKYHLSSFLLSTYSALLFHFKPHHVKLNEDLDPRKEQKLQRMQMIFVPSYMRRNNKLHENDWQGSIENICSLMQNLKPRKPISVWNTSVGCQ